jgi:hypothetical protein
MGSTGRSGKDKCILTTFGTRASDGSSTFRVRIDVCVCMYETVFDCMRLYFAHIHIYVIVLACMCRYVYV